MDQQFLCPSFGTLCQFTGKRDIISTYYITADVLESSVDDHQKFNAVCDAYYSSVGSSGILKITNFCPKDLEIEHDESGNTVSYILNHRGSKRCICFSTNILFMTITVYKNGGAGEFVASIIKIDAYTLQ